jgi:hypothetical protein
VTESHERTPDPAVAPSSDPLALVDGVPLSDDEAHYVGAARAANTLRGYCSDWKEWCSWCASEGAEPLGGGPATLSRYLTFLTGHGAAVGTMSRRLSAIRFAHRLTGHEERCHQGQVPLGLGAPPSGAGSAAVASSRAAASGSRMARGAPSTRRGLGTAAMGLPSTMSSAPRKSKNRDNDEWAAGSPPDHTAT